LIFRNPLHLQSNQAISTRMTRMLRSADFRGFFIFMMKRYLVFGISIQLLLLTGSCESDINLFYESGDRPVVYCLLNPKDSIQYLRVSRSFIIRGNTEGQVISPDSLILDEDFYAYLELTSVTVACFRAMDWSFLRPIALWKEEKIMVCMYIFLNYPGWLPELSL